MGDYSVQSSKYNNLGQYGISAAADGNAEDVSAQDIYQALFPTGEKPAASVKQIEKLLFAALKTEKNPEGDNVVDNILYRLEQLSQGDVGKSSKIKAVKDNLAKKRIAVFGDSITAHRDGYVDKLNEIYPDKHFAKFGVVGETTFKILGRMKQRELGNYSEAIILGGVNSISAGRSAETVIGELQEMYDQAKAAGLRVIAMTISPWKGYKKSWTPIKGARTEEVNDYIMNKAQNVDVAIDIYAALGSEEDPLMMDPDYTKDGLHPLVRTSAKDGHQVIAEAIYYKAYDKMHGSKAGKKGSSG